MFGGILQKGIPAEHPVPADRKEKEQDGDPAIGITLHFAAPVLVNCIPIRRKSRVKMPSARAGRYSALVNALARVVRGQKLLDRAYAAGRPGWPDHPAQVARA
jgi:hypothetical protein